jgi:hypothetical protein
VDVFACVQREQANAVTEGNFLQAKAYGCLRSTCDLRAAYYHAADEPRI